MKIIPNQKVIMVDCDETLILWSIANAPKEKLITLSINELSAAVLPHQKNINLFIKLAKMNYSMCVWSRTGFDWAEAIVKALNLEQYTTLCLSKPLFYLDDAPAESWMGKRLWRDPVTGEEAI